MRDYLTEFKLQYGIDVMSFIALTDGSSHNVFSRGQASLVDKITNKTISWIGDGNNNMSNSLIEAAGKFNFKLKIGCPDKYKPGKNIMIWAKKNKVN